MSINPEHFSESKMRLAASTSITEAPNSASETKWDKSKCLSAGSEINLEYKESVLIDMKSLLAFT